MSSETGTRNSDTRRADALLSAHYRSIADESTPQHLDTAVLRRAGIAAGKGNSWFGPAGWHRPAAFAATLLLGVVLLFELSNVGVLETSTGVPADSPPEQTNNAAPTLSLPAAAQSEAARIRALPGVESTTRDAAAGEVNMAPSQNLPAVVGGMSEGCSEEQKSATGSWWQCIDALQNQGLPGLAERELNDLLQAYPGFALPQRR